MVWTKCGIVVLSHDGLALNGHKIQRDTECHTVTSCPLFNAISILGWKSNPSALGWNVAVKDCHRVRMSPCHRVKVSQ
jgi:hypothetical protein